MDLNDDFINAYFEEELRAFGSQLGNYDGSISNDLVDAYMCRDCI